MADNIYSKGTRVWLTDKDQGWISAEVTQVSKGDNDTIKLAFVDERGKVSSRLYVTYFSSSTETVSAGNKHRDDGQGH